MRVLYLLLFLSFISVVGCTQNETYVETETKISTSKLILDTSYCEIPIDSLQSGYYKISSVTKEGLFCGYNRKRNSLDIFSLSERKLVKQIILAENNKPIEEVASVNCVDANNFYILTKSNIFCIDSTGRIKTNILINNSIAFFKDNFFREVDAGRNFSYNPQNKKIYLTNHLHTGDSEKAEFYKTPTMAEITFPKDGRVSMRLIPVNFSLLYFNGNFGYMNYPQQRLSNDGKYVFFNFPIDPNLYRYNIKTEKTEVFGGKPTVKEMNGKSIAVPLMDDELKSEDKRFGHYLKNVNYFPIIEDASGEFYYRIFSAPLAQKGKNNFSELKKKNRYISIFDNKFREIGTEPLFDKLYFLPGAFSTGEGLFLPCPNKKPFLRFKVFKFKSI